MRAPVASGCVGEGARPRRAPARALDGRPEFAAPARVAPHGPIALRVVVPIARAGADPRLEAGKRRNVELAATAFHGVATSAARPLSFWRTLGPATAARGFAWGMELRSGCAVPAIGGGLCLLSNALFAAATLAVVENAVVVDDHQCVPHALRTCLDCGQTRVSGARDAARARRGDDRDRRGGGRSRARSARRRVARARSDGRGPDPFDVRAFAHAIAAAR